MNAENDDDTVEAMMKQMVDWATEMIGYFPAGPVREGYGYNHEKIPASRIYLTPPKATQEVYRHCAQQIIRAAVNVSDAKPEQWASTRVAAVIGYLDMFNSEVCVFFIHDYWTSFVDRNSDDYRWTPLLSESSLAARLGLKVPEGFCELGYKTFLRDDSFDPPFEEEGEIWIYSDRKE